VLPETFHADGAAFGYTANYTPVRVVSGGRVGVAHPGEDIVDVKIKNVDGDWCVGTCTP
jgi:type 1 glutamine amidotransferase